MVKMLAIFMALALLVAPVSAFADAEAADVPADATTTEAAVDTTVYWEWIDLQSLRLYELGVDFVTPDSVAPISDGALAELNAVPPLEGALTWPLILAKFDSTEPDDPSSFTIANEYYSSDAPDLITYLNMIMYDTITVQGAVSNMAISDVAELTLADKTFSELTANYGDNMIIDILVTVYENSFYSFTFTGTKASHDIIMPTVTEAITASVIAGEEEAVG